MPKIDLSNLRFPVIKCTRSAYDNLEERIPNTLYVITNASMMEPTLFFNEKAIANVVDNQGVKSVNNKFGTDGILTLVPEDFDTYSKEEFDALLASYTSEDGDVQLASTDTAPSMERIVNKSSWIV